jgi:hypothetical protein
MAGAAAAIIPCRQLIDWGMTAFSTQHCADQLEIVVFRVNAGPTLVASELPSMRRMLISANQPCPMIFWTAFVHRGHRVELKIPPNRYDKHATGHRVTLLEELTLTPGLDLS